MQLCHLNKFMKYANYLIESFMNINVSIRNKRKLLEKVRWFTFKITYISTANYPRLHNLVTKMIK